MTLIFGVVGIPVTLVPAHGRSRFGMVVQSVS